ncbi:MAG: murein biosynthesis integral membrane protein MurJ [bacterium]
MSLHLNKKTILKKTAQVGSLTFLSRIFGIIREIVQVKFLGIGAISDAFIMAFRIPNLFRRVFAEGAMSASFVPVMVQAVKKDERDLASGLITLSLLFFQGLIFLLFIFVFFKTDFVVSCIAAGFTGERAAYTVKFLRILFPFLFLVSASALFAGALNAVNHFFIPAFGQVLWNVMYIGTLFVCVRYQLAPEWVCWGVLIAGGVQLLSHLVVYFKYRFMFGRITREVLASFKIVLRKFFPCFFGVSIVEINLFISAIVASFLPAGDVSLLYYGARFLHLPVGMFVVAFSSILLPHFSRMVLYAPKRMSFYLLESTKFVCWIIIPFTIILTLVSEKLFITLFSLKKGAVVYSTQAQWILIFYLMGLVFLCLNKVFMNIFYSIKDTTSTTIISVIGAIVNLVGDIVGMELWGAYGIAGATSLSALVMALLSVRGLRKKHKFRFYGWDFINFLLRFIVQIATLIGLGILLFVGFDILVAGRLNLFLESLGGYWFFAMCVAGIFFLLLLATNKIFGVRVYFLKK